MMLLLEFMALRAFYKVGRLKLLRSPAPANPGSGLSCLMYSHLAYTPYYFLLFHWDWANAARRESTAWSWHVQGSVFILRPH